MTYTFGELFAGVGGLSLGFEAAGWQPSWHVELDSHCQGVLARHWPGVPLYGDVRTVAGGHVSLAGLAPSAHGRLFGHVDAEESSRSVLDPVNCVAFGSPCQDFSTAGTRAGLNGRRSGLFFEALRIIGEMRRATTTFPRLAVWENVPGALTSNGGRDFGAALDALAELGAVDITWRVVNAQHFGVPQRRRRVFTVADFGGHAAGALHLEPSGTDWRSEPGTQEGCHDARTVEYFNPRRLTPLECERLNGWPDNHTKWAADGTVIPDTYRYHQTGNGIAAPCARWLAHNLRTALESENP